VSFTDRFLRTSIRQQVDEELSLHLALVERELIARGMRPAAARDEARRRFGDVDAVKGVCRGIAHQQERDMRRTEYLDELRQDLTYAVRQLVKQPTLTIVAGLTLALGIGATPAIFSALESVVLRPYPFAHPERVMILLEHWQNRDGNASAGNFVEWQASTRSFDVMAAEDFNSFNLTEGDTPERVVGGQATADFFKVFGVAPLLGRTIAPDEDAPGHEQVVVLSYDLWKGRFGGDRMLLNRTIKLSSRDYTVIGVMPPGFDPTLSSEKLWVPAAFTPERKASHDNHQFTVVALRKAGVTAAAAEHDVNEVMHDITRRFPRDATEMSVHAQSLPDFLIGSFRQQLFFVLGAVGVVLLIACGNVANLLLARGAARAKEMALRGALGAGRARLVRQLLTESVVLGLVAAGLGVGLAWGGVKLLVASAPAGIPRLDETRVDALVLAFALAVALLSSVVFGLVPALRAARVDLQAALREGGRGMGTAKDRVRAVLIGAEVALALSLLVGAGLLIRSSIVLRNTDPGFDLTRMVSARVALPAVTYQEPDQVRRAFEGILAQLQTEPGVRAASIVSQAPLGGGGGSNGLLPEGKEPVPANFILSNRRLVPPGYLATMGIALLRGRALDEHDVAGAPRVMVVSAELARRAWPGENPIGKRIACCEGTPTDPRLKTVIGVAADVHQQGPTVAFAPEFYLPMAQVPPEAWGWVRRTMTLVARGATDDAAPVVAAMRDAVRRVDPALPIYGVSTMRDALGQSTAQARFNMILLTTLGIIGLILAAVGTYGVVSYFVSLRTHEIGVRMALGADRGDVLKLMAWQGLRPILAGVAAGTVAGLWGATLLKDSLYGVSANDPVTFAAVAAALIGAGLLATLIPARRATGVSPMRALDSA
jgi:predicted permease